jgi:hypothetical protein
MEDVQQWMEKIDDSRYNYLEGMTSAKIQSDKEAVLQEYNEEQKKQWLEKLSSYRVVDNLQDLRLGKYCRWIVVAENHTAVLHGGGYLIKVAFMDNGLYLTCERMKKYKMQVNMENAIIFQKLTAEEHILIMANDYVEGERSSPLPPPF